MSGLYMYCLKTQQEKTWMSEKYAGLEPPRKYYVVNTGNYECEPSVKEEQVLLCFLVGLFVCYLYF